MKSVACMKCGGSGVWTRGGRRDNCAPCNGTGLIWLHDIERLRAYWMDRLERGAVSEILYSHRIAEIDEMERKLRADVIRPYNLFEHCPAPATPAPSTVDKFQVWDITLVNHINSLPGRIKIGINSKVETINEALRERGLNWVAGIGKRGIKDLSS